MYLLRQFVVLDEDMLGLTDKAESLHSGEYLGRPLPGDPPHRECLVLETSTIFELNRSNASKEFLLEAWESQQQCLGSKGPRTCAAQDLPGVGAVGQRSCALLELSATIEDCLLYIFAVFVLLHTVWIIKS